MNKLLLLIPFLLVGCGSDSASPDDDKKLRATLGQKEIDFTSVPPENRAMVLGQMRAHGASAKADALEKQWGTKK